MDGLRERKDDHQSFVDGLDSTYTLAPEKNQRRSRENFLESYVETPSSPSTEAWGGPKS